MEARHKGHCAVCKRGVQGAHRARWAHGWKRTWAGAHRQMTQSCESMAGVAQPLDASFADGRQHGRALGGALAKMYGKELPLPLYTRVGR